MRVLLRVAFVLTLLFAGASRSWATPISYVHTGSGSGTLDGVPFGSLAPLSFTITAASDTTTVESCGGPCLSNDNLTASIEITGLGTFDFITPTRYFSNLGIVGFSRAGTTGSDLFNGPIVDWDMVSSIGPIAGTAELFQWTSPTWTAIDTSGGVLVFNNAETASTFTATVGETDVVPEPATIVLLGTGLLGAGVRRWRRR